MAQYTEYHPLKFWLDPASIAEIVAHIQTYLVNNPINSTTEIETIIHDYLIAHPELIGGVDSVNGQTGEVVLTADNISGGENVTIKDILDSLQDQIDDIVASIQSDYQQLIDDVSDLKSAICQNIRELDDGKRIFEMVWGNISPDGSINYNYPSRVINYTYEKFTSDTVLSLETGYGLILALYDDSYALTRRTIYASGNVITVPANTFFRVCVYHGTIVPSSIADLADKVTYTSDIQTEIDSAMTAALAITNGGIALTTVTDLNTTAATVMNGDYRAAFFRYTGSTLNIPTTRGGFVFINREGTLYQTQVAMPVGGGLYIRIRDNGTWSNWQRVDSALANGGMELTTVTDLNTTATTVMNGDRKVGLYRYDSTAANIPTASSGFVCIYRGGTLYQTQIAMPITGGLFARNRLDGVWNTWRRVDSAPRVYHVEKDGSGDYTSLVDCITEATQYIDSVVYVGEGEWNICDELGETYLNEVSSTHGKRGPYLKNRIHLIFASNSKVVCNYTGAREDTMRWLSPFNAGIYGFTLENANIEASNCRYCVHDERDSDTDAYVNKYINCRMHLDNSTNTVIRSCNPIGGGLGKDGYVEIDGCWFKGERTYVYTENLPLVTYHNSAAAGAKSHISLKNSYFADDGRPRFNWYGQSQLITDVEVCGCSMGSPILSKAETTDGSSPYQNISIIEWNNTVRT